MRRLTRLKINRQQAANHGCRVISGQWSGKCNTVSHLREVSLVFGPQPQTQRQAVGLVYQGENENHESLGGGAGTRVQRDRMVSELGAKTLAERVENKIEFKAVAAVGKLDPIGDQRRADAEYNV
jgi:hypothetical protein